MRKPASTSATKSIPGEDVCDGITFEMFYERTGNHPRCAINYDPSHFVLQQLDYLAFIDIYAERIRAFHVKDAEFNPTGRQGVYSGFQPWINRAGRFRSLGDGQVDFKAIFSRLAAIGFDRWAVLEWECCLKNAEDGAREGAAFIRDHIIRVTDKAFDDFAGGASDDDAGPAGAGPRLSAGINRQGYATWPSHAFDWEWSAAEKAPSSAPSTASPRASTIAMNWSPARFPLRPTRRCGRPRRSGLRSDRSYPDFRDHGAGRGRANRRHRGGRDRHAEPYARARRRGLSRDRCSYHLRQAVDGNP